MKKRLTFLLVAGVVLSLSAPAQNRKIDFHENGAWKEVLEAARKENRIIFMDCYTVWCGPCKVLDRDVFTNDEVADYFNGHFVNAKYDMEKGEGIELKNKYTVTAYPTLLFIDARTQEVIHRVAGSRGPEDLLAQARIALDPAANLQGIREAYETGEKNAQTLGIYLAALRRASMTPEMNRVTVEYMTGLTNEQLMQEENWNLLERNITDPLSEPIQRVFANRAAFVEGVGEKRVSEKLSATLMIAVHRFRNKETDPVPDFDQARYDALEAFMLKTDDPAAPANLAQLRVAGYAQHGEYRKMITALTELVKKDMLIEQLKPTFLMTYMTKLMGRTAVKKEAMALMDMAIADTDDNQMKGSYSLIKGLLLESYGDTKGAEKAKAEAQKYREKGGPPRMMRMG